MKRLALALIVSLTSISGFAASFDCAKARSASEKIVCDDMELSEADERLVGLVIAAKHKAADKRAFQREQDNAWLERQKCKDVACVRSWYAKRIAAVSGSSAPEMKAKKDLPAPVAKPAVSAAPPLPAPVAPAKPVPAPVAVAPAPAPALAALKPAPAAAIAAVKPSPVPVPAPAVAAAQPAPPPPARLEAAPAPMPKPVAQAVPPAVPAAAQPAASIAAVATPATQFQTVGEKLGFDIPATKADFLSRFAKTGGQCGVSKNLASLKAVSRSAVSDCWSGSQCPAYSKDVNCKVVRTAFDDTGRLVLFMATLNTISNETAKSTRDMGVVVRKFSGMGGTSPIVRKVRGGHMMTLSGTEGALRFDADVMAADGEQQIGMFWVSLR